MWFPHAKCGPDSALRIGKAQCTLPVCRAAEEDDLSVTNSDVILLGHATFGVLGTLSALWVFVEALNAREESAGRTRNAALIAAVCMLAAWILGGYWYLRFYPADKTIILNGPWPFAHNLFMETKEHFFFLTLILTLYLVFATRNKLRANPGLRKMVLTVSFLIVLSGLAMEGFGGVVNHGAEVALKANMRGTQK
jgi:hypothetical protein